MKKKFSLLLLALVLVVAMAVPAFARTELKDLEDGTFEVTFIYGGNLDAAEVYVAGEFNDWKAAHPDWKMSKKDGVWKITKVLEKGKYQYKFTVNGSDWVKDNEAEDFAPDGVGGQNSVVKVMSNALKGEFKVSGELINTLEQKGENADISFNNEFKLKVVGNAQEKVGDKNIDRFRYKAQLGFDSNIANIKDNLVQVDSATIDNAYIDNAEITYLNDLADISLQAETKDLTDSYDYLGLLDANTDTDDRDNTTNPNELVGEDNHMRRVKITHDKWADAKLGLTEYIAEDSYLRDEEATEKYMGYANVKKDLLDGMVTVGSHIQVNEGQDGVTAEHLSAFGSVEPIKDLTVKAEYANLTTKKMKEGGGWTFTFDPANYEGKLDKDPSEIEEVHLVGSFQDWDPADKSYALTKQDDGTWQGEFFDISEGSEFKFMYDADSWDAGHEFGTEKVGEESSNVIVETASPVVDAEQEYDRGNAYLTEANYKFVDQDASMKARIKSGDYSITKYKGNVTVGTKAVAANAYLPIADDDLAADGDTGFVEYYANGEYDLLSNLTVDANLLYKTQEKDTNEVMNQEVKAGMDWTNPVEGLDNVKGHFKFDPEATNDFSDEDEVQEIFAEAKTSIVPGLKFVKANTSQHLDSEIQEYYVESELDIPVEQVAHIKGNLRYAKDPVTGFEDDSAIKYFAEAKVHHLPVVQDYITHAVVNYTADDNGGTGLVEDANYEDQDDNDNDWVQKVYAETKILVPQVSNISDNFAWDGLLTKFETRKLEAEKANSIEDLDENFNAKYTVEGQQVEWYTLTTIETGFDLPFKTTLDATIKYDMNHGEISEYEDDGLKVELEKEVNFRTKINALYNKKDGDEGENYSKVTVETLF